MKSLHDQTASRVAQCKPTLKSIRFRFTIDLMCAPDSAADIALHVAVRFSDQQVIRKHLKKGKWHQPDTDGPFPFRHGGICGILITVRQKGYDVRIAVDWDKYSVIAFWYETRKARSIHVWQNRTILTCRFRVRKEQMGQCQSPTSFPDLFSRLAYFTTASSGYVLSLLTLTVEQYFRETTCFFLFGFWKV